jgi:hypothetical protein
MERRVSVNEIATPAVTPDGLPQGWSQEAWLEADTTGQGTELGPISNIRKAIASTDQGPCLYLGPSGQRCNKRALASGFCAAHGPNATMGRATNPRRWWAVAAAIAGLLWPYLEFVLREIIRWAHSR